ncbi:hypothetical protein CKS_3123 [Pantoea stewartii subsp. stewartii DC283]|uniref:Uncharacterized protein n=1 Tax=Pantoea stewartii subsp. stewartii DC283 TaxID=660596 RepID=H3RKC9_PANSE|nr:hypothetical protein CKS_3123 [Pantoea stewartii subsp. stewartii DC283]
MHYTLIFIAFLSKKMGVIFNTSP